MDDFDLLFHQITNNHISEYLKSIYVYSSEMPARKVICPYCGWSSDTFMFDDEIEEGGIKCPKCGCPITLSIVKELNKPGMPPTKELDNGKRSEDLGRHPLKKQ